MRCASLLPAAVLGFVLAGCATYVPVRHVVAPANLKTGDVARLRRIVAVMKLGEPLKPAGLLGKAAQNVVENAVNDRAAEFPIPRAEAVTLLEATAAALAFPVSEVAAYMVRGGSTTRFLGELEPTAVLWLDPSNLRGVQTETVGTYGGRRVRAWVIKSRFEMAYRLESWPEGGTLAQRQFQQPAEASYTAKHNLKEWLIAQKDQRRTWLGGLEHDLLPTAAIRYRTLQKKSKRPEFKAGVKAAKRGDWGAAREAWERDARVSSDYRTPWNLGICHELKGEWDEARDAYTRAMASASGDAGWELKGYLGQLNQVYRPPKAEGAAAAARMDAPLAVMPLANNTVDVSAPERVREKIRDRLARMGYAVLPLEETARRMRSIGVSDGAHLKAIPPEKVAEAAGTNRILSGTLQEFRTVNVGIYQLAHVSIGLALTDERGNRIWEHAGDGYREIVVRAEQAGEAFLAGLVGTAVGKVTKQHLNEEIEAAVLHALETLPAFPSRR